MMDSSSRLRNVTGRRLLAAFAGVLLLFAAALVMELFTMRRIAEAEAEVARLDHAKHAGHMAAAQVREQYVLQYTGRHSNEVDRVKFLEGNSNLGDAGRIARQGDDDDHDDRDHDD